MMIRKYMIITLSIFILMFIAAYIAFAADITVSKDSANFEVKYEANSKAELEALYSIHGILTDPFVLSWAGGIQFADTYNDNDTKEGGAVGEQYFLMGDGSKWTSKVNGSTGYTVECRIKTVMQAASIHQNYAFAIFSGNNVRSQIFGINVDSVGFEGFDPAIYMDTTDDFHVYRYACAPDSPEVTDLWVDGNKVASDIGTVYGAYHQLYWGDGSGGWGGEYYLDYLRWTPGAYKPVCGTIDVTAAVEDITSTDTVVNLDIMYLSIELMNADKTRVGFAKFPLNDEIPVQKFDVTPGKYYVKVSGLKWLTKIVEVNVAANETKNINISLPNGDITGDGAINVADYNAIKRNWFKTGN
jgi:hypothetical protein